MTTLREQVAQAIGDEMMGIATHAGRLGGWIVDDERALADAAIGVVLGVVADEIKALPKTGEGTWRPEAVLAVVERLRG